ncbi:hypothetical protein DFP73DRAFT_592707 [Morchella snyderi]|nr:hypothetical protein DFP73DRAFT_592707 [Morchella snyderi]
MPVIYERQMGTWHRSFPDAESSMLVLTGIRQEITKRVKLTNSCKLPSMESKEALVDPGVGNFLAGLRAKLNDGNDEIGIYPDDLESGFVNDDDMNVCGEIDDAEHIDGAERSAGNPSVRQLVLEDDERANTAVESEDSQDNVPVRRRGSRRSGRGRRAR